MCQDVPYDNPNPWSLIDVEPISLDKDKGELNWKWGNLDKSADSGWREFRYDFRVINDNGHWKISYLRGFDFKETTRKDGQL
jgi:hypothetical protein